MEMSAKLNQGVGKVFKRVLAQMNKEAAATGETLGEKDKPCMVM